MLLKFVLGDDLGDIGDLGDLGESLVVWKNSISKSSKHLTKCTCFALRMTGSLKQSEAEILIDGSFTNNLFRRALYSSETFRPTIDTYSLMIIFITRLE